MKRLFFLVLFSASLIADGQALKEINFRYLYDHESQVMLKFRPVRLADHWECLYSLTARDTAALLKHFTVEWQIRNSLSDRSGTAVSDSIVTRSKQNNAIVGTIKLPLSNEVQYLVGKVIDGQNKRAYLFYSTLEPNFPETRFVTVNDGPMLNRYALTGSSFRVEGAGQFNISFYKDDFPTAPLAFSEALGKVSRQMEVDSTFTIGGGNSFNLTTQGLYLIQKDTTSAEGISFRVEQDYPRYTKISSIADPLVYICSSQEYDRIKEANGDKKTFDRVILSITKDAERAKRLMRSYFKRVEISNLFFTSYKEGWKTDRGMIYVIFGMPDEVFRYSDREVWNYKNDQYRIDFEFIKSPSLFDPENYVLIRNKKYKQTWYEVVDLWRKARF